MDMMKAIIVFSNYFCHRALKKPLYPLHGVSSNAHFLLVGANFVILLPVVTRYVRMPVNTSTGTVLLLLLHLLPNSNIANILILNVLNQGRDFMLNKRWTTIAEPNEVYHKLKTMAVVVSIIYCAV
jgi:hypothetical protein